MLISQESKYEARGDRLFNRATGQQIPDNEPVFVLRAKDKHALAALNAYLKAVETPEHAAAVQLRIGDFLNFRNHNPSRMKEPDTARTTR